MINSCNPCLHPYSAHVCPKCQHQLGEDVTHCDQCGQQLRLIYQTPTNQVTYSIMRIVKAGGHGAIYACQDQHGNVYAVKEMVDHFHNPHERSEALDRFTTEIQLLRRFNHPRIPRIYHHFVDQGRYYLVMDLVDGEDLEQVVERNGALAEMSVLEWAIQICDVLEYLHQYGLIYRDMKPSNIMLDRRDGRIKIVDFGIAKRFRPADRNTLTGTPGYAPPEQYQGFATPASDIYALGATLFHLLSGRDPRDIPPFPLPPICDINPAVSRETCEVIAGALHLDPVERYRTVGEFRSALRERLQALRRQEEQVPADTKPAQPQPKRPIAPPTTHLPQPVAPATVSATPPATSAPAPPPAKRRQWRPRLSPTFSWVAILVALLTITMTAMLLGFSPTLLDIPFLR